MNVYSKSVPGPDEDVITISVEATRLAMKRAKIDGANIGAIYTGSESHPYAVKPTSTIVAEAISATPNLTAADFEFACKVDIIIRKRSNVDRKVLSIFLSILCSIASL